MTTVSPMDTQSGTWKPVVGARTAAFVKKKTTGENALSELSMGVVLGEATDILAH